MTTNKFTPQDCRWIEYEALPHIQDNRQVLLFGAGEGSVELLKINDELDTPYTIVAIVDNDSSMWGKELHGYPIVGPDAIAGYSNCAIIITTVSGRDAVSLQLRNMGYSAGTDYYAIGCYPSAADSNLQLLLRYHDELGLFSEGQTIVHVGPGGFLGLECCLQALGCSTISFDAYAFHMSYPDITTSMTKYEHSHDVMLSRFPNEKDKADFSHAFYSLFSQENGQSLLDAERVTYKKPVRFSSLPLEDESVDGVISFAVLEHVREPSKAVQEIYRILRPGGFALQRIITCDHRSYGKVEGYHPLSYLLHTDEQWEKINCNKFYQNRLIPDEWKGLFEKQFSIEAYEILTHFEISDALHQSISAYRKDCSKELLSQLNCDIVVRKK